MSAPVLALSSVPLAWRRALPALLLVLTAVLVAYRDTVAAMIAIWSRSDTFAHAYLVLPIVLWLIWRQRHVLAVLQPQPCAWMLLPMAAAGFIWLLGDLVAVNSVTQLALIALLVLAVPAVFGLQIANAIRFPLAFMFFAVPIGEFLMPQLMAWTADFTVLALRVSGIPVFREGTQFVIPSGSWSVVEACSGVRYLIASFMVGTLFAYLNYRSARRRWLFVGIAIVVPIVANWVRAYLIVLIGHLSNNTLAVGVDHLVYGWLFFGVVIGVMYAIGALWSEPPGAAPGPSAHRAPASPPRRGVPMWAMAGGAAVVTLLPHLALQTIGAADGAGGAPQLVRLDQPAGGWRLVPRPIADWKPAFRNPTAELTAGYTEGGREVGLYIGYYRQQSYVRKLVSSDNDLVNSTDPVWARAGPTQSHRVETLTPPLDVRSTQLRRNAVGDAAESRFAVWQVYWVGGRLTASDITAKVYGALDRLRGRGDDAAVILLYTPAELPGRAQAALESFARANLGAIVAQLGRTRDGHPASVASRHSLREEGFK